MLKLWNSNFSLGNSSPYGVIFASLSERVVLVIAHGSQGVSLNVLSRNLIVEFHKNDQMLSFNIAINRLKHFAIKPTIIGTASRTTYIHVTLVVYKFWSDIPTFNFQEIAKVGMSDQNFGNVVLTWVFTPLPDFYIEQSGKVGMSP